MNVMQGKTIDQLELSRNYHDMSGIDNLRAAAKNGDEKALHEAAKQFEAIFVHMMLKSMRQAQDVMSDENSPFNSQQVKFYRDMHDQQLANDLSSQGAMGLADLIVKQLSPQTQQDFMPSSVIRNDGNGEVRQASARWNQNAREDLHSVINDKRTAFESPKDFVATLYPIAEKVASELGLDAKSLVSQAALETGWGQHMIHTREGKNSHNLFGIKAHRDWSGDKAVVETLEFKDGLPEKQKAAFRAYGSFEDAMRDYAHFVKSHPRYEQALNQTHEPQSYFTELQRAGYATDPQYAQKVMAVYHGDTLREALP